MNDIMVEKAPHYNQHPSGVECIEIVQHFNFNIGSCMKYLFRAGLKNKETLIQDLQKAQKYIQYEIERIEKYGP